MRQAEPEYDTPDAASEPQEAPARLAQPKELSRLERLKLKIKKLGGKNPDIYPMF